MIKTQWWTHGKTSLTKYLPLTLFVSFERVVQSLRVRGSWKPNITEIFWPRSYGRQRCVFLVLHGGSSGALKFTLLRAGYPYNISLSVCNYTACPQLYLPVSTVLNSSALYYLQTPTRWYGHASMPPQLLAISGDRNVSLPVPLEWPVWSSSSGNNCHTVQRSLSSGATVYESIMGFFFISSHFINQFPPRDFLSQLPLECVTSFRCITLKGIFGYESYQSKK